jgi:hypothetical protein
LDVGHAEGAETASHLPADAEEPDDQCRDGRRHEEDPADRSHRSTIYRPPGPVNG